MNDNDHKVTGALVKAQGTGIQKVPGGLVRRGMEDVQSLIQIETLEIASLFQILKGQLGDVAYPLAFSPNGALLASKGSDNSLKIWDTQNGNELKKFVGHTDFVISVAFSPDGKYLASGSGDGTVRIWSIE